MFTSEQQEAINAAIEGRLAKQKRRHERELQELIIERDQARAEVDRLRRELDERPRPRLAALISTWLRR